MIMRQSHQVGQGVQIDLIITVDCHLCPATADIIQGSRAMLAWAEHRDQSARFGFTGMTAITRVDFVSSALLNVVTKAALVSTKLEYRVRGRNGG